SILYFVGEHDKSYSEAGKASKNGYHLRFFEEKLGEKLVELKSENERTFMNDANHASVPIRLFKFDPSQSIDELLENLREIKYELSPTQKAIISDSYKMSSNYIIEGPAGTGKSLLLFRAVFRECLELMADKNAVSNAMYVSCSKNLSKHWENHYNRVKRESKIPTEFTIIQGLVPGLEKSFDNLEFLLNNLNINRESESTLKRYFPERDSHEFIETFSRFLYSVKTVNLEGVLADDERNKVIHLLKKCGYTDEPLDELADVVDKILRKISEKRKDAMTHDKKDLSLPWEVMEKALLSPKDLSEYLLLVDEAQDFTEIELKYLASCNPASYIIACDYNQQVLGRFSRKEFITRHFDNAKQYSLKEVYRNTRDIFLLAREFGNKLATKDSDLPTEPVMPYQKPIVSRSSGLDSLVYNLKRRIDGSNKVMLAILFPNKNMKRDFLDLFDDCDEREIHPFLISEIKGLEFSNVILYNPHKMDNSEARVLNEKLYTSITRAKYMLLTVFTADAPVSEEIFSRFFSDTGLDGHGKASVEMDLADAIRELIEYGKTSIDYGELLNTVTQRARNLLKQYRQFSKESDLEKAVTLMSKHGMYSELSNYLFEIGELFYAAEIAHRANDEDLIRRVSEQEELIGLALENA
ncbi:MAG: hypothetical protein JW697_09500, partial [Kosmotogaceae bacterium]|nr:hypothetical protein [Kosmotogaceae bacterium]